MEVIGLVIAVACLVVAVVACFYALRFRRENEAMRDVVDRAARASIEPVPVLDVLGLAAARRRLAIFILHGEYPPES